MRTAFCSLVVAAGLTLAGCDRGAAPTTTATNATSGRGGPASTAPTAPPPDHATAPIAGIRLMRGPGEARYRLVMQGFNQQQELRIEQTTEFTLKAADDGRERVEILSASRVLPPARDPEPIACEPECRRTFGGDENALARFTITATTLRKPNDVVPACVSRDVFGIVTDLLMFLSVQSQEYGIDKLRAPGDRHAFGPFQSEWTQPPDVVHGRIVCSGGEVVLEKIDADRALVRWLPKPFDQGSIPTPRGDITRLIAGTESLSLALEIDITTGVLISATCERDELDLQGWSPFPADRVPDRADWPKTSGIQMKALRKLKLEQIDAPPG